MSSQQGIRRKKALATLRSLVFLVLLVNCSAQVVKINAGGPIVAPDWRCDTGKFVTTSSSIQYTSKRPIAKMTHPGAIYQSHRFIPTVSKLEYKIPIPAGSYDVQLLFAETWAGSGVDKRKFTIMINNIPLKTTTMDTELDIYAMAGGFDKPYLLQAGKHSSVGGFMNISFGRIAGKNNPMISGIIISGNGADQLIGSEGLGSCGVSTPAPKPTISSPATSVAPACDKPTETEFGSTHFAHAVAGGPYIVTDLMNQGFVSVDLDGTNSHSHFQSGSENGKIVKFKWTWKDPSNPKADANGIVTVTTSQSTHNFPVGVTSITLVVEDQFCNSASETTTVTVNSGTKTGAYCYYYDFGAQNLNDVPLPLDVKTGPKPKYGVRFDDINFGTTESFGKFPFKQNTFAVRCVFQVTVNTPSDIQYEVTHSGPVKVYHEGALVGSSTSKAVNVMTKTTSKTFSKGPQEWQVLYLRPSGVQGTIKFRFGSGAVIPASTIRHNSGTVVPIITGISKTEGSTEELMFISGLSFVTDAIVRFGSSQAETVESSAESIQVRVPEGTGTVDITVTTQAGLSNSVKFTYKAADSFPIKFTEDTLKTTAGTRYELRKIAVVKYGPDGRLYCGSTENMIYALTLNKNLQVTKKCEKNVFEKWTRAVLGLGFDPTKNDLKLYFTTSTMFWKEYNIINDPAIGWTNGKVKSVTMAGPNGCFNNDVSDVVTGLPVSNHDHAVQAIEFLPGGKMIISIGGFTNGGISSPGDKLGGFPSNPLAGALVECPTSGTNMVYTSTNPLEAKIQSGACKTYATGFRNTFAMALHTNGKLYATDNGPNKTFGDFSTNCAGGKTPSKNINDKFILVQPGKCHGHPSINRGLNGNPAECVFGDSRCVKPLIGNLESSTNGVIEYQSNIFGDKMKGNVFLAKHSTDRNPGRITRIVLNAEGTIAENGVTQEFKSISGLSLVEGPRGEMIMGRFIQKDFVVLRPDYVTPTEPFFISVLPRRGPAVGGTTVLVTGHNFGNTPSAKFGNKPCTNVKVIDTDSFTCVTPAGSKNAKVQVSVSTGAVTGITGSGTDYWYF